MSAADSGDEDSFGAVLRTYREAAQLSLANVAYWLSKRGFTRDQRTVHGWEGAGHFPRGLYPTLVRDLEDYLLEKAGVDERRGVRPGRLVSAFERAQERERAGQQARAQERKRAQDQKRARKQVIGRFKRETAQPHFLNRDRAIAAALGAPVCAVAEARLEDVGVDPVDPKVLQRALKVTAGQLRYVTRGAVDQRLRKHLRRASAGNGPALVCLYGASKAGKSRSILEALKHELRDAAIVAPDETSENLQTIIDLGLLEDIAAQYAGRVVLWLDDLEGFVRVGDSGGLNRQILKSLKEKLPGLVVAATAGGRGRMMLTRPKQTGLFEPLNELLDHGITEYLDSGLTTPAERDALALVVPPDLAIEMQRGLGEVAVSGRRLVQILIDGSNPRFDDGRVSVEGAAITWAAITVHRFGLTKPVPDAVLRRLCACYANALSDDSFERGLRWATEPLYARVSLLRKHGAARSPYDYVVQHAPAVDPDVERCVWRELLETDSADDVLLLGLHASRRDAREDAVAALGRADALGSADAAFALGQELHERGDFAGAEAAWRRGYERGSPLAGNNLGLVLNARGDVAGGEAVWRRTQQRGGVGGAAAANNLGDLLERRGDQKGAEEAYRRSNELGSTLGSRALGRLLYNAGDLEAAERAFRRADDGGDADAAFYLGVLRKKAGDDRKAEMAWRRADARGSADGASNLAIMLHERGDKEGAEAACRRADERGSANGAYGLGQLLREQGDSQGAEAAYCRADERGSADGAFMLGVLLNKAGNKEEAKAAWWRADERGSADGAHELCKFLSERGNAAGAEAACRRADERGSAEGACTLGALLCNAGNKEEAEAAWRRADERGSAGGAYNLGVLLYQRGELEKAEAAWRRADERDSADASYNLGVLLRDRHRDLEAAAAAFRRALSSPNPEVSASARDALDHLIS